MPAVDRFADAHQALADLPREHGFEPLAVDGTLPVDLRGTVYRNGPMLMAAAGRRYDHWFDGDGGLSAVRFDAGRALGAARVTRSRGLLEERAAGKLLYGGYGTVQPGLMRRLRGGLKNTANTAVLHWNSRLFGLMEATLPTEISPDDLTTIGETDLEGAIAGSFSAHPHYVPERRAAYNFGVRYGRKTQLDLYELPDGGPARRLATHELPGPTMIHDFIVTAKHLVFFVPPLRLRVLRMFLGLGGFSSNLEWKPALGTEVLIVPIDDPGNPVRFTTEAFYQWHYANAFERGGELVIDFVRYRDFASDDWLRELFQGRTVNAAAVPIDGMLHRAVIDPARRTLRSEQRWDVPCEFPRVAPRVEASAYRYCYAAAHSPESQAQGFQDTIARIDVETGEARSYQLPARQSTGEPLFVPRPGASHGAAGEADGYLLALVYDAATHASSCIVLDARALEAGPIARAHFDHHIPPRFHGVFVPAK